MKGAWTRFDVGHAGRAARRARRGRLRRWQRAWSAEGDGVGAEVPPPGPEDGPAWLAAPDCGVPVDVDRRLLGPGGPVRRRAGGHRQRGRRPVLGGGRGPDTAARPRPGGGGRLGGRRPDPGRASWAVTPAGGWWPNHGSWPPGDGSRQGRRRSGGPRRQGADADTPARSASTSPAWRWTPPWPPICSTRPTTATACPTWRPGTSASPSTTVRGPRARAPSCSRSPTTRPDRDDPAGTRSHRTGPRAPGGRAGPAARPAAAGVGRDRRGRPVRGHGAAARAGAGPHGGRGHPGRPRGAAGHRRRV